MTSNVHSLMRLIACSSEYFRQFRCLTNVFCERTKGPGPLNWKEVWGIGIYWAAHFSRFPPFIFETLGRVADESRLLRIIYVDLHLGL